MSESSDYTPAPGWSGHDFASARGAYKSVVDRSYATAVAADVDAVSLIPENISTECENPLVIICDVTGSMDEWPATIFSKLPYLEHEGKEYLGEDMEIAFLAVGDAPARDKYALQVQNFAKGPDLKESLAKLIHEKGGGGDSEESYELGALYLAENCETPNAIRKPLCIIIGDEGIHSVLTEDEAKKWCRTSIAGRLTAKEVFDRLLAKFDVYIIRKPYNCSDNSSSPANERIQQQWETILGADHVVSLPDPDRVVDVIFGILGQVSGRYDDFVKELNDRQGKDRDGEYKVDVVLKSLRTIHAPSKVSMKKLVSPSRVNSVTNRSKPAKASKSLLDE